VIEAKVWVTCQEISTHETAEYMKERALEAEFLEEYLHSYNAHCKGCVKNAKATEYCKDVLLNHPKKKKTHKWSR
jgi:hypothetical protein